LSGGAVEFIQPAVNHRGWNMLGLHNSLGRWRQSCDPACCLLGPGFRLRKWWTGTLARCLDEKHRQLDRGWRKDVFVPEHAAWRVPDGRAGGRTAFPGGARGNRIHSTRRAGVALAAHGTRAGVGGRQTAQGGRLNSGTKRSRPAAPPTQASRMPRHQTCRCDRRGWRGIERHARSSARLIRGDGGSRRRNGHGSAPQASLAVGAATYAYAGLDMQRSSGIIHAREWPGSKHGASTDGIRSQAHLSRDAARRWGAPHVSFKTPSAVLDLGVWPRAGRRKLSP